MKIGGLQKLTLLDYPGLVACTVFTVGCNYRCPFCHNASLVTGRQYEDYSTEQVLSFLESRKRKLDGVCITGGEPLLQKDLYDFISEIKKMNFLVKLDTNGSLPDKLEQLINNNMIDFVAMDIKNSKRKYERCVGVPDFDTSVIDRSIEIIRNSGIDHEFRTTVVYEMHNENDFRQIGEWLQGDDKYFLQGFVDSGDIIEDGLHACDKEDMRRFLDIVKPFMPNAEIRG